MVAIKVHPRSSLKLKFDRNNNDIEHDPKSTISSRSATFLENYNYYYYLSNSDFSIVWTNVAIFVFGHLLYAHGFHQLMAYGTIQNWYTVFYINILGIFIGISLTGGAHRMWAHRAYEASLPLRIIYMIGHTIIGQNCLYIWCRDHRVHHKWSDTDGDPHNTKRGIFFAHCGWLMRKKHPYLIEKSRTLDFSDLLADPVVKFQKDYYWQLYLVFSLILPWVIPVYFWDDSIWMAFQITFTGRYISSLHVTWFVNSAAHMFGDRPYKDGISPVQNIWVSITAYGEGYHNYHHAFPNDYRGSEQGLGFNIARHLIEFLAKHGHTYNLRKASDRVVEEFKRKVREDKCVIDNTLNETYEY